MFIRFLNLIIIVDVIIEFSCRSDSNNNRIIHSATKKPFGSYLIKFLTPETKYPVELTDFSNDSTTKWFKYGSQKYVDQLETFGSLLSFNKTKQRNNLVLKSFNKNILDHYETQPLFDDNQLGIDEG